MEYIQLIDINTNVTDFEGNTIVVSKGLLFAPENVPLDSFIKDFVKLLQKDPDSSAYISEGAANYEIFYEHGKIKKSRIIGISARAAIAMIKGEMDSSSVEKTLTTLKSEIVEVAYADLKSGRVEPSNHAGGGNGTELPC